MGKLFKCDEELVVTNHIRQRNDYIKKKKRKLSES